TLRRGTPHLAPAYRKWVKASRPRLKYLAVSTAFRCRVAIAKTTSMDDLRSLVARWHPVATEHGLIRVGCDGDGGYLVPDDLNGIQACLSPRVDNRPRVGD